MLREPSTLTFREMAPGTRLYIDSNIFVYRSTMDSYECRYLIRRCAQKEVRAFTGTHVLLEVAHRLMMVEAVDIGLVTPGNVPSKLNRRPSLASQLHEYSDSVQFILNIGIEIFQVDTEILETSANLRSQTGFLVNDSVSPAMMQHRRIPAIATNDKDFQRVNWPEVHLPSDH